MGFPGSASCLAAELVLEEEMKARLEDATPVGATSALAGKELWDPDELLKFSPSTLPPTKVEEVIDVAGRIWRDVE